MHDPHGEEQAGRAMRLLRPFPLGLALSFIASLLVCNEAKSAEVTYTGQLSLVRYDMPRGLSDGYAPTRQLAKRNPDAPDAVDWPDFTLNGQPIFRDRAEERVPLKLHSGEEASSPFQLPSDDVVQPGNHWFRAMEWRPGRRHIYTAETTARTANSGEGTTGRYELWAFPVQIKAQGAPTVKNVVLKAGGTVVYKRGGPWRSLTLLLPANQPGHRYELSVDGRPPVQFDVGLMPVKLGAPREQLFLVNAKLPGEPAITVEALTRAGEFPNPKEWAADLAALSLPIPAIAPMPKDGSRLQQRLGAEVPRSPVRVYGMALPHGMSGGFFGKGGRAFKGNVEEYAAHLEALGFDTVFDQVNTLPARADLNSVETRAAALAARGLQFGIQYDNNWSRPALQHPNVAFFAHTLPEWHAPLYRSLSLAAQRFSKLPNFAGISIGSDNAGYASYWNWASPIPDRPWGEGMTQFIGSTQPAIPRAPVLGKGERSFEWPTHDTAEFIKYVNRYEATFRQYGYFAEAVRDVDRDLVFTTGSFGSAPGQGGRGGWPWASIPGRPIFEGLPVQQAYDWNELHAAKPLHLVALIDRMRSYYPRKRTWALIDNFRLLYGREAFQRAVALTLTRGVQGVGTNFLPTNSANNDASGASAYLREMNDWIHQYGGVFAHTEPAASIGIFYGHHQALQRPVLTGENPPDAKLYDGSHEGKVAEALFLCHAAGWPARVITFQELRREPLPASMKAILLVGLDQADPSWHWAQGLEEPLQQFLNRGGRILADDVSFSPVPVVRPGLRLAAYVQQSDLDPTPRLLERNRDNIEKLRVAMQDVEKPVATSESATLWAIPTQCGDVQYITAVNQACAEGEEAKEFLRPADPRATKPEIWKTKANASLYVKPQSRTLRWNTDRPIYDVRAGRKLSLVEAANVDLTRDAFQWFAVPPAEIVAPELTVQAESKPGRNTFYEAVVTIRNPQPICGVPVKVTVTNGNQSADLFAASGWPARLPITLADRGNWKVTATELLSGLSSSTSITPPGLPMTEAPVSLVQVREPEVVKRFATRKHVALTIALTPEQERDGRLVALARALESFYREQGRVVSMNTVEAGGVVESLQPLRSPNRYPQWKTVPSDLVLLGTPSTNVLLLDQARAQLFENPTPEIPEKGAIIYYTRSPFVGEYDAVNICAGDIAGIETAVRELTAKPKLDAAPAQ